MTRILTLTLLVLSFTSTARADECANLVPAGQDVHLYADIVAKCRERSVQATLADAVAANASVDVSQDRQIADIQARLDAEAQASARAPTPSAPVVQTPAPQPAPVQQQAVYMPQGPALGQIIPVGVAIGPMPPSGGSVRAGVHLYGFIGVSGTGTAFGVNGMICAEEAGMPLGIAGGVPIAVSVGDQVERRLCAPASAELNVFNLAPTARVGFGLYRPSPSRYGVYDLYVTLSCSGSTRGGMQPKNVDACRLTYGTP